MLCVQAHQPSDNDAWAGAKANNIKLRTPQQALDTSSDSWAEQALLQHSHQLQARASMDNDINTLHSA